MSESDLAFDAAIMMFRNQKFQEASDLCWQVIRGNPGHADAWAMRGRVEAHFGRPQNAVLHYGQAVQAAPDRWDLWHNMAIDAMGARMYPESERFFLKSIELKDMPQTHYNYGNLCSAMMRVDDAVHQFKTALEMGWSDPQIYPNLGTALIAQGSWREGFNLFRQRFNAPGFPPRPRFDYPIWQGEPLDGKTILLYVEQGFGDEILSLRFAQSVKALGARVIVSVRSPMYRLARSILDWPQDAPDAVILMYDEPPWKPDYMCALLDVPAYVTSIAPATVPGKSGYLTTEDRSYTLEFPPGLNIGVCWLSGKRDLQPSLSEMAKAKSLTFEQLVKPLKQDGINLFCLQQTHQDGRAIYELGVLDLMCGIGDFMDTAWVMDKLDLIITCDTSIAHVAGALGKPVWNLVRFDAFWPWGTETDRSCWYDSMKIYRQIKPFDWEEPLKRIQDDLIKFRGRS